MGNCFDSFSNDEENVQPNHEWYDHSPQDGPWREPAPPVSPLYLTQREQRLNNDIVQLFGDPIVRIAFCGVAGSGKSELIRAIAQTYAPGENDQNGKKSNEIRGATVYRIPKLLGPSTFIFDLPGAQTRHAQNDDYRKLPNKRPWNRKSAAEAAKAPLGAYLGGGF